MTGPSLVIAPFLAGQYFCEEAVGDAAVHNDDDAAYACAARGSTGAARISAALDAIGPVRSSSGKYQLGYTLTVPLFRYFRKLDGRWQFDADTLQRNFATIAGVERPVVVYLSCNHFIDAGRDLCAELVRDPANLMTNHRGPVLSGTYFDATIVPWTLVNLNAPVNVLRRQALEGAMGVLCRLPEQSRQRIVAVSVFGEVHHLFDGFFAGPGFDSPLSSATDYSPAAASAFRTWLCRRYGDIGGVNRDLEAGFGTFADIDPPAGDINTGNIRSFFEHIDAHAAGSLPIVGWVHDAHGRDFDVEVFLDGELRGIAQKGLSRTDVTDAVPAIVDPNVGFRLNLDFRGIAYGIHTLEVVVRIAGCPALRLARQPVVLVNRRQDTPPSIESSEIAMLPVSSSPHVSGALDHPRPWAPAFYNPLARLWLEFRNEVVRNYLEYFTTIAGGSGFGSDRIFSHQVTPSLVGSWNGDLMAADLSKRPSASHLPGTTLYGGAAFGAAFVEMKKALGWERYGVGEMHPMVRLEPRQYQAMFEMHRINGAVYVAPYYLSVAPERLLATANDHGRFRISPDNPRLGSDAYWYAISDLMRQ